MIDADLKFVIPTYRLRDVSETVEAYDENFWRNGQAAPIIVFDDSSVANHEKYYGGLEHTKTHNELFYVGPAEKEQFVSYICRRLRDKKLDVLVRNLFRPSYGGNRNFTLMYTLGELVVSADDDMRPYALIEASSFRTVQMAIRASHSIYSNPFATFSARRSATCRRTTRRATC
jgi:hypothetical protein